MKASEGLERQKRGLRGKWVIAAANILALVAIIISTQFLFLPFGFKNDPVTNLPWHWYRKPVTVEYWSRAGKGIVATNSNVDALLILRELKGMVSELQPAEDAPYTPNYIVNIKRASDGFLLFTMDGHDLSGPFTLQDNHEVRVLPEAVRELIEQTLSELDDGSW